MNIAADNSPNKWHLAGAEIDGHSAGMCGQIVTTGHGTTTDLDNVQCFACLKAEIKWLDGLLRRIREIAEGQA